MIFNQQEWISKGGTLMKKYIPSVWVQRTWILLAHVHLSLSLEANHKEISQNLPLVTKESEPVATVARKVTQRRKEANLHVLCLCLDKLFVCANVYLVQQTIIVLPWKSYIIIYKMSSVTRMAKTQFWQNFTIVPFSRGQSHIVILYTCISTSVGPPVIFTSRLCTLHVAGCS